jgi:predicted secreted protein
MGPVLGTAIYAILWWVVFFAVLPWGVRGQHEDGVTAPGSDPGAPIRPLMWRKAGITTLIAGILWLGVFMVIRNPPEIAVDFFEGARSPSWMQDQGSPGSRQSGDEPAIPARSPADSSVQ